MREKLGNFLLKSSLFFAEILLTLSPQEWEASFLFVSVDNEVVEETDERDLLLESSDPAVDIPAPLGQITVLDNDGM